MPKTRRTMVVFSFRGKPSLDQKSKSNEPPPDWAPLIIAAFPASPSRVVPFREFYPVKREVYIFRQVHAERHGSGPGPDSFSTNLKPTTISGKDRFHFNDVDSTGIHGKCLPESARPSGPKPTCSPSLSPRRETSLSSGSGEWSEGDSDAMDTVKSCLFNNGMWSLANAV